MSITYVNAELRHLVQTRADFLCEYCLIADMDTGLVKPPCFSRMT
jgi:hypothetical protein